ncbi:hypothetical protein K438DRAFT_1924915 [Mycena galopus ATCC 62051]|nr:hypothetical protein K438DRAFT_1924915 [Mycena galopus ATCC 62051]
MDDGGAVWRPAKRLKKSNSKDEDVKGALLRDVADIYLANLPELQIQPPAQANFYVSRRFLLDKFRVLNQTFLGYFKPTNDSEHRRGAIFPQPGLNPFLPQAPGAAGLIFASRFEIIVDHELPWALFCKHKSAGGKIVWRYMGDYRNRHCGDLTAEQFKSQATAVKQQWGKLLIKSKMVEAYIAMRARIALRKAGVAFVRGDANEIREMGEVTRKGGRPLPVEAKDIIDALGRGEEVIGIIRMECISYNHELVAEMARRHEDWNVAPVPVQPVQRAGATKRRKRVSKTATRRICSDSSTSDYSPESESEDGASADLFAERARRQKRAHVDEPLRLSLGLGCDSSMSDLTELGDD